jgi:hypothetical protein
VRAEAAPSRRERTRLRTAALQARAKRVAQRAEAERAKHGSVDAVFEAVDRELEVGGGIIAGALAYRFFIWLLPCALVLVAGLGIAAGASSTSPVAAYLMAPWALSKQGTYGALGIAAALLIALFLVSRLMVGAALLNATLWERKTRALPESRGRAR